MKYNKIKLVVIIAISVLISCNKANSVKTKMKRKKQVYVNIEKSFHKTMVSSIKVPGTITANRYTNVVSPVNGIVETLFAKENSFVKKGTIIATVNPNERLSVITNSQLKIDQLKKKFEKVSKNDYGYNKLKKELQKAEEDYAYAKNLFNLNPVVCPIDGMVTMKMLNVGSQVSEKGKLFTITDMSSLVVKAEVNEKYFEAIYRGKKLPLILNAYPEDTLTGKIGTVYPQVSSVSRSIMFDINILNFNKKLVPGMMANITIPTVIKQNTIAVNIDALLSSPDNNNFLYVVNDKGIANRRIVDTGISMGNNIEITKGLDVNESVVVKGQEMLKNKMKVMIINSSQSN